MRGRRKAEKAGKLYNNNHNTESLKISEGPSLLKPKEKVEEKERKPRNLGTSIPRQEEKTQKPRNLGRPEFD